MALEGLYIRVTHAGASTGAILLNDVNSGFIRSSAARVRRPGPVYVPASDSVELVLDSTVLLSYESGAIRQFVDAGELTVSLIGGAVQVLQYLYDFDALGGAVADSPFTLTDLQGTSKVLPAGTLILRSWVNVVDAFAGVGASVSFGTATDSGGFLSATAVGTLVDNYFTAGGGALEETNNTSEETVVADVSGADLTAGKAVVSLEVLAVFE